MGGQSCCRLDCLRLLLHFGSEDHGWELHKPWTSMCLGSKNDAEVRTCHMRPCCTILYRFILLIHIIFLRIISSASEISLSEVVHWTAPRSVARATKPFWPEWLPTLVQAISVRMMAFMSMCPESTQQLCQQKSNKSHQCWPSIHSIPPSQHGCLICVFNVFLSVSGDQRTDWNCAAGSFWTRPLQPDTPLHRHFGHCWALL